MENVEVIKKLAVLFSVLVIATAGLTCYLGYRHKYLNSYCEIELEKITQCDVSEANTPHWTTVITKEQLNNIEKKYSFKMASVDFKNDMLVISYGAELIKLDYNLMDSVYKTRGHYIGFADFGNAEQNTVFIYKAHSIPLFDTDTAGVSPNYRGKYRN